MKKDIYYSVDGQTLYVYLTEYEEGFSIVGKINRFLCLYHIHILQETLW